jgi:hypothetical protein
MVTIQESHQELAHDKSSCSFLQSLGDEKEIIDNREGNNR